MRTARVIIGFMDDGCGQEFGEESLIGCTFDCAQHHAEAVVEAAIAADRPEPGDGMAVKMLVRRVAERDPE